VFYDRLVDDHDRAWLFSFVCDVTQLHLDADSDTLLAHLSAHYDEDHHVARHEEDHVTDDDAHTTSEGCHVTEDDLHSLVFCDFSDVKSDLKYYEEVREVERLRLVVENYVDEYNNVSKTPMNLVMFRFEV